MAAWNILHKMEAKINVAKFDGTSFQHGITMLKSSRLSGINRLFRSQHFRQASQSIPSFTLPFTIRFPTTLQHPALSSLPFLHSLFRIPPLIAIRPLRPSPAVQPLPNPPNQGCNPLRAHSFQLLHSPSAFNKTPPDCPPSSLRATPPPKGSYNLSH